MNDPYRLSTPAVVSFSGGRTSAYMLWHVLRAFGGRLPADVAVTFANTGKERQETLEFVEECSRRWSVPVVWLEYRYRPLPVLRSPKTGEPRCMDPRSHGFAVVDFATASRRGEPFDACVEARNAWRAATGQPPVLPNPRVRFCSAELKTRTKGRYVRQALRWTGYANAIGMRADEPARAKALLSCDWQADSACPGERPVCPLYEAGVTEADVMSFWAAQPFDLRLRQYEGNCDACFLKSRAKVEAILADRPDVADWWAAHEAAAGVPFRIDRPGYADLQRAARQPSLFPLALAAGEDEIACACTD